MKKIYRIRKFIVLNQIGEGKGYYKLEKKVLFYRWRKVKTYPIYFDKAEEAFEWVKEKYPNRVSFDTKNKLIVVGKKCFFDTLIIKTIELWKK